MGRKNRDGHGGGHGNSERWLLTYADMITLLMAFFIMLYSMSILNLNKFNAVAISIKSGFNGEADGAGQNILSQSGNFSIKPSPIDVGSTMVTPKMMKKMREMMKKNGDMIGNVKVHEEDRGLVISLSTNSVIFESGQAELSPTAKRILTHVAEVLAIGPNDIEVEGHTCNLPVVSDKYPTNWELSSARASRVVRYLVEDGGLSPDRFSVIGYADRRPVPGVPNTNEANRAQNRRVDIVVGKDSHS